MVLGVRNSLLRDVRIEVLRLVSDLVYHGVATAGTSTTLTDTGRILASTTDALRGYWIYIYKGTGEGQERIISASNTSGQVTVSPAWGTTPDTTSEYIITRRFSASQVDTAIDAAISRYARRCSVPWSDRSLGVNNIFNDPESIADINADGSMLNWQFDRWDTQHVPNDWTLVNDNSDEEESSQVFGGHRRSLKLTNAGASAASATLGVANYKKWIGRRVRAYGLLSAETASRAFVRVGDGVGTSDSDYHGGDGSWERLSPDWHTVAADASALEASYQIASGGAITVYASAMQLIADEDFQRYAIPHPFTVIEDVFVEMTNMNDYGRYFVQPVPRVLWDIDPGGHTNARPRPDSVRGQDSFAMPALVFKAGLPTPGRIYLKGRGFPNLIAKATATIGGPGATTNYEDISPVAAPELIRYAAALELNQQSPIKAVSSSWLSAREEQLARQYTTRMPAGGRRVRDW